MASGGVCYDRIYRRSLRSGSPVRRQLKHRKIKSELCNTKIASVDSALKAYGLGLGPKDKCGKLYQEPWEYVCYEVE